MIDDPNIRPPDDTSMPDDSISDALMPDDSMPDTIMSDDATSDTKISDDTIPDTTMPDTPLSDFDMPDEQELIVNIDPSDEVGPLDEVSPPDGVEPPDGVGPPDDTEPSSRSKNTGLSFGTAVLVILLAAIPLLAVLYLGNQILELPFPPFDLYSWPGLAGFSPWIAINDALIGTAAINPDDLLQRTTQAKWILGATLYFLLALVVGLIFYAFVRLSGRRPRLAGGLVAGLLLSAPLIYVNINAADSELPNMHVTAWLAGASMLWGVAVSYAFGQLIRITRQQPPEAPTLDGMDRRQFLFQFGAGAAAITAISGATATAIVPEPTAVSEPPRTLPMISPEMMEAQQELFGEFRRFAIVRKLETIETELNVLALGAEYPDRNYVSIWIGGQSPIIVYGNLQSALEAFSTDEYTADAYWFDG